MFLYSKFHFTYTNIDECMQIMDIAILADISQSMKKNDRHQMGEIINKLVDELGVSADGNHFITTLDRTSRVA